jgi:hypothetical protein
MRATRAYVAGFGTAGSLVAGAAILFVVASAVVSFQGWSQISISGSPATLPANGGTAASRTPVSQRLAAAAAQVAAPRPAISQPATVAPAGGAVAVQPLAQPPSVAPVPSPLGGPTKQTGGPGGGSSQNPSPTSQLGTVVQGATNQLGGTLNSTGQTLGSAVTTLVGRVASKLSGSLGTTVRKAGNALGTTISATGATAGGLVSGVGKILTVH